MMRRLSGSVVLYWNALCWDSPVPPPMLPVSITFTIAGGVPLTARISSRLPLRPPPKSISTDGRLNSWSCAPPYITGGICAFGTGVVLAVKGDEPPGFLFITWCLDPVRRLGSLPEKAMLPIHHILIAKNGIVELFYEAERLHAGARAGPPPANDVARLKINLLRGVRELLRIAQDFAGGREPVVHGNAVDLVNGIWLPVFLHDFGEGLAENTEIGGDGLDELEEIPILIGPQNEVLEQLAVVLIALALFHRFDGIAARDNAFGRRIDAGADPRNIQIGIPQRLLALHIGERCALALPPLVGWQPQGLVLIPGQLNGAAGFGDLSGLIGDGRKVAPPHYFLDRFFGRARPGSAIAFTHGHSSSS